MKTAIHKKHFSSLLLLSFIFQAAAQDVAEDLLAVNRAYQNAAGYSFTVTHKLYTDYSASAPYHSYKGYFKKRGSSYCSFLLGIETMQNENFLILADSSEKTIVISDPKPASKIPLQANLDTLVRLFSSVQFSENNNQKVYKLFFDKKNFGVDRMDILINKETFFIQRMVLFYSDAVSVNDDNSSAAKSKPRLEIEYSGIKAGNKPEAAFFSEKKYIKYTGNGIACAENFKGYSLIDRRTAKNP